jgi:succinate dehydrogenase / fumarate reductase cytochrome b subunit
LLSAGAVVLGIWLIAAASGEQSYDDVSAVLGAPWFKIPLVGWAFCFFFHLANGVRHLAWDTGAGFERSRIRATGWAVLAFTVLATAAFAWLVIF